MLFGPFNTYLLVFSLYLAMTCDMWHVTRGGGEHSRKSSPPQLLWLGINDVFKIGRKRMNDLMNYWITKVFVEQPWLHRVCMNEMDEFVKPFCESQVYFDCYFFYFFFFALFSFLGNIVCTFSCLVVFIAKCSHNAVLL